VLVDTQDPRFAGDLGRALLSVHPGGIVACSAAGECLWVNDAAAQLLGVAHDALLHLHLAEIEALSGSGLPARADETMRTGRPCRVCADLDLGDGGSRSLTFQLSRVELIGQPSLLILISDAGDCHEERAAARASVERYRQLVDATTDLIYGFDTALTLTGINRAAAQSLGLQPAEAVGRPLADLGVPVNTFDLWMKMAEAVRSSRSVVREVLELTMPDGQTHAYESVLGPIFDDEDRLVGFRGVSRDVTALRRAENELRTSEERFRGIFEQGSVGIALLDPDQTLVRANAAFCSMLGYTEDELLGLKIADITAAEDVQSSVEASRELYSGARSVLAMEKRYRRKDGGLIWGDLSASLVHGNDGRPIGSLAMVQDVTSRKEAEESLRLAEFSVNHAGLGVFWCDPDGRFLSVNDYICERLGYSRAELLSMTVADVDPNAPRPWGDHWADLRRRGSQTFESVMRTKGGEEFPIDATANYVEFGGKEYNFGLAVDITERKAAEKAVRESEDRYQTLVNLSPDAMIVNVGGKYAFANPAAARLFGASSPEDLLGQDVMQRIHPDDRERVAARVALVFEGAVTPPTEIKVLRLDGSPVEVEVTAARVEFDGSPAGQVIFRDVAERRRAEELLRLTQFSVDRVADSVFWADSDAHLIYVSDSTCRLHGYSRDEMLGLTLFDLDRSLSAEQWSANWRRMKRDGPFTFDAVHCAKDGSAIPVEVSVNYLEFNGKEYNCAFVRDTTDRIRAEEERVELERRLQQSQRLESLGVLAGGIAHDFNNILMSVLGNAELALTTLPAASSVRGNLLEITASSRRAADLCRQMLAYSGRGQLVAEAIDLGALIENLLGFLRSTVSKKALFDIDLGENLPLMRGDASQVSQVIMNLVLNASEALGENGGVIAIATGVKQCSSKDLEGMCGDENLSPGLYLTLEISDTGSGMDMVTQDRIFEPFFTTKFSGRGLGLSAVLGIVRGHKGGLRLSSEVGKGTTFAILFPATEAAIESTAHINGGTKDLWRGKGTVLLVDDEEAIRTLGEAMLHLLGFTVLTAADGREAVSVYAEHREEIALVLLDLTMPRMNGEETFQKLRALDPGVRVVLSSGYARADVIARFAGMGLVGFVHKPYSLDELTEQLRAALEGGSAG
jgi:two-component system, cell cycle sensor histidine kinase and response regulator CckA